MGSITYTNTCACTRENERERAREREKERDMVPWHIVSTSVLSVLVTEEKKKESLFVSLAEIIRSITQTVFRPW